MPAVQYDITIEQGATYHFPRFRFGTLLVDDVGDPILDADGNQQIDVPRDFTGCKFRLQMRKDQKPTSDAIFTITSEDTNGGISIATDGAIVCVVPDEQTDAVSKPGYWDLKCYNLDGSEDRLVEGKVLLSPAVTTDAP